jgi:hypothetical protein
MGLFGSKKNGPAREKQIPPMGSGRRLASALGVTETLNTLEAVVSGYRPPKYANMPYLVDTGFAWLADPADTPRAVVSCEDAQDDFQLVALIERASGTEIGLFPLGSGDARLTLNIVGHWKQRDPSLTSRGTWPAGTIALRPPRVTDDLFQVALARAGYPPSGRNMLIIAEQLFSGFLMKASDFVSRLDSERAALQFIDDHQKKAVWSMDDLSGPLQSVVDDLVKWNPRVLPYIQELPWMVSAVYLDGDHVGGYWDQMEKS